MLSPFPRVVLWTASHSLAILAGWGIWSTAQDRLGGEAGEGGQGKLKFRSHERTHTSRGRVDDLLNRISAERGNSTPSKIKRAEAYQIGLTHAEELRKMAEGMELAADPAAAAGEKLDAILAGFRTGRDLDVELAKEANVRLYQWMEEDPKAVIAWFAGKSREDLGAIVPYLRNSLNAVILHHGVEEAAKWVGANVRMDGELTRMIADHAGAAADAGQLSRLKAGLDPQRWNEVRLSLIDTWPMAKADGLFNLAQSENAPLGVLLYAKQQGKAGMEWLQKHLESGDIDPAFRSSLLKHHDYHQLMYASPQMDFDKRVEVVGTFEPGKTKEQVRLELGVQDVVNQLNSGRDWRYAFRSGAATAEEIYREMAAALPELAAKSPESLKLQLYKELSEFGGEKALPLLDHLPADQKWAMVMKAPQWNFLEANPQDFHDLIRTIPADTGDPAVWETRLRTWEDKTRRYRARLGAAQFDEWVKNLPDGIDREMASYALARQIGTRNPELAEDLKGKIKNPQLKQRLEVEP